MTELVKLEIKTMKELNHPYLLGINFVTIENTAIYLSMPFSLGGDVSGLFYKLRNAYRGRKASKNKDGTVNDAIAIDKDSYFHERQILYWAKQMITGIGALHRQGLVHKDIKLPNTLINEDYSIIVCDFGLAEYVEAG